MKQRSFWKNVLCAALAMVWVPLLYSLMAAAPASAATPKHYTDLSFSPLPEVNVPAYERFRLPNGLIVYLMEDH
ncbi:MAG TPA: insulinase family protein, partial [Stenomitos sp.]